MNHCIFCGPTETKLTKEHIFSAWVSKILRPYLGDGKGHAVRKSHSWGKLSSELKYPGAAMVETVRDVCAKCNNENLSILENNYAKPILGPLIIGKTRNLTVKEQVTAAAWITKLVMVFEFTSPPAATDFFTQREREHFLKTYQPPPNTWIWLAGIESRYLAGLVQHIFRKAPPGDPDDRICCATGVAGGLAFQMLVRRSMDPAISGWVQDRLAMWRSHTLLIYPQIYDVRFPPREILTNESLDLFASRFGAPGPIV